MTGSFFDGEELKFFQSCLSKSNRQPLPWLLGQPFFREFGAGLPHNCSWSMLIKEHFHRLANWICEVEVEDKEREEPVQYKPLLFVLFCQMQKTYKLDPALRPELLVYYLEEVDRRIASQQDRLKRFFLQQNRATKYDSLSPTFKLDLDSVIQQFEERFQKEKTGIWYFPLMAKQFYATKKPSDSESYIKQIDLAKDLMIPRLINYIEETFDPSGEIYAPPDQIVLDGFVTNDLDSFSRQLDGRMNVRCLSERFQANSPLYTFISIRISASSSNDFMRLHDLFERYCEYQRHKLKDNPHFSERYCVFFVIYVIDRKIQKPPSTTIFFPTDKQYKENVIQRLPHHFDGYVKKEKIDFLLDAIREQRDSWQIFQRLELAQGWFFGGG